MKRLSHLMMKKWRETERWKERRRSEPCGSADVVEKRTRAAETAARETGKTTPRRRSEPCGQVAEEEEDEEEEDQKKEEEEEERQKMEERQRRKSEPSVRLEERRKTRTDRRTGGEKRRRRSESGIIDAESIREDSQRQTRQREGDRETDVWTDRQTLCRRSEPCWALMLQLPPLSDRKRKEVLDRRRGRKTDRQMDRKPEVTEGQTDRKWEEDRKLYRRKSEPGPPGISEYNNQLDLLYIRCTHYLYI